MLWGGIYKWFLFSRIDFEVIVKPQKKNKGPDHLSILHLGESRKSIDEMIPNTQLFRVEVVDDNFFYVATYLMTGISPRKLTTLQKK